MSNAAWVVALTLYFGFFIGMCVALFLCFRRSGNKGFLWLGIALVLWPIADAGLDVLREHYANIVLAGGRPWLFPYSLMVDGLHGWSGWQMPTGQFRCVHDYVKELIGQSLLLFSFIVLLKGFSKNKKDDTEEKMLPTEPS